MFMGQRYAVPGGGPWKVSAAGLTDPGRLRDHNEDAFSINPDLGLYLVSDGMGGGKAGEAASAAVARSLPLRLAELTSRRPCHGAAAMADILGEAVALLSDALLAQAAAGPALHDSGATVAACWLLDGAAALVHMGDSRAYRLRGGRLERLTADHTVASMLGQMGRIDENEAWPRPGRHALTRYVGMEPAAQPEAAVLDVGPGDRLLLCTDGLWGMVDEGRLADLLAAETGLENICEQLIGAANAAGGPDNITAVVIKVDQPGEDRDAVLAAAGARRAAAVAWEA